MSVNLREILHWLQARIMLDGEKRWTMWEQFAGPDPEVWVLLQCGSGVGESVWGLQTRDWLLRVSRWHGHDWWQDVSRYQWVYPGAQHMSGRGLCQHGGELHLQLSGRSDAGLLRKWLLSVLVISSIINIPSTPLIIDIIESSDNIISHNRNCLSRPETGALPSRIQTWNVHQHYPRTFFKEDMLLFPGPRMGWQVFPMSQTRVSGVHQSVRQDGGGCQWVCSVPWDLQQWSLQEHCRIIWMHL